MNGRSLLYEAAEGQGLYKLVLVVAEACNLRCTYCYAEGGPYGRNVSVMAPQTARQAIREMFTKHRPIQTLQFFGGEPSLNLAAMQSAVEEVHLMIREGELTAPPRFSIVTNGANLTEELLRFYKSTDILITVSHDGPQDVQDALRPSSHGAGTFRTVDETLERLKAAGIPFDGFIAKFGIRTDKVKSPCRSQ
jgi:uncharacterized protein